jgi:hypothetical protein
LDQSGYFKDCDVSRGIRRRPETAQSAFENALPRGDILWLIAPYRLRSPGHSDPVPEFITMAEFSSNI